MNKIQQLKNKYFGTQYVQIKTFTRQGNFIVPVKYFLDSYVVKIHGKRFVLYPGGRVFGTIWQWSPLTSDIKEYYNE